MVVYPVLLCPLGRVTYLCLCLPCFCTCSTKYLNLLNEVARGHPNQRHWNCSCSLQRRKVV